MEFTHKLKQLAEQIIYIAKDQHNRTITWDQSPGAPASGYPDRAGFIIDENIELYTDIAILEQEEYGLLRARLSKVEKLTDGNEVFTLITLDFNANREEISSMIANKQSLTFEALTDQLQKDTTQPKLIHVSLHTELDSSGKVKGTRYEYDASLIKELSLNEQNAFASAVEEAIDFIQTTAKS
jgi:hypothetical protein